jgi:hypothetical protein
LQAAAHVLEDLRQMRSLQETINAVHLNEKSKEQLGRRDRSLSPGRSQSPSSGKSLKQLELEGEIRRQETQAATVNKYRQARSPELGRRDRSLSPGRSQSPSSGKSLKQLELEGEIRRQETQAATVNKYRQARSRSAELRELRSSLLLLQRQIERSSSSSLGKKACGSAAPFTPPDVPLCSGSSSRSDGGSTVAKVGGVHTHTRTHTSTHTHAHTQLAPTPLLMVR